MCEYDPGCSRVTDPVAARLSETPRADQAICTVLAAKCLCRLALAYHLPGLGGDVLCQPHMKVLARSWLKSDALSTAPKWLHWHPALTKLQDFGEGAVEYGRCRHGTWNYRPAHIREVVAANREGRLIPAADLVRVEHPNGMITKMGKSSAERHRMKIVGQVERNPVLQRPFVLAGYVGMADALERWGEAASGEI